jgi:hypothetical protein
VVWFGYISQLSSGGVCSSRIKHPRRWSVLQDRPFKCKEIYLNFFSGCILESMAWSLSWIPEPVVMEERKSIAAALVRDFEHLLYRDS